MFLAGDTDAVILICRENDKNKWLGSFFDTMIVASGDQCVSQIIATVFSGFREDEMITSDSHVKLCRELFYYRLSIPLTLKLLLEKTPEKIDNKIKWREDV